MKSHEMLYATNRAAYSGVRAQLDSNGTLVSLRDVAWAQDHSIEPVHSDRRGKQQYSAWVLQEKLCKTLESCQRGEGLHCWFGMSDTQFLCNITENDGKVVQAQSAFQLIWIWAISAEVAKGQL